MPNQFQVGDRVRCLANAAGQYTRGNIYTVRNASDYSVFTERDDAGNLHNGWAAENFELVTQEAPIPDTTTVSFYTVVYKRDPAAIRQIYGFETERSFNEFKERAGRLGYIILAEKKLKLTNVGAQ